MAGIFLPGSQKPAVQQLVDGDNDGRGILKVLREPFPHALGVAGQGIVVLQFAGGHGDFKARNLAAADDELAAGRAAIEGQQGYLSLGADLGQGQGLPGGGGMMQVPEGEASQNYEHGNEKRVEFFIRKQDDAPSRWIWLKSSGRLC